MARPQSHGENAYRKRKCRCEICVAAHEETKKARRKYAERSFKIPAGPLVEFIRGLDERKGGMLDVRLKDWEKNGVDVFTADRNCCMRGYHPWEVYGDAWFEFGPKETV